MDRDLVRAAEMPWKYASFSEVLGCWLPSVLAASCVEAEAEALCCARCCAMKASGSAGSSVSRSWIAAATAPSTADLC
eukprot:6573512-Prymnesium_polylepis.1